MTQPLRDIRSVKFYQFLREVAAEISARTADVSYVQGVSVDPKRDEGEMLTVAGLRLALAGTLLYVGDRPAGAIARLPSALADLTPAIVADALFGIAERACFEDKATEADWRRAKVLRQTLSATYNVFLQQLLQARANELFNAEARRTAAGKDGRPTGYQFPIAERHPIMSEITLQRAILPFGDPEKLMIAAACLSRLPEERRGQAAAALLWLSSVPEEMTRGDYASIVTIVGETYGT